MIGAILGFFQRNTILVFIVLAIIGTLGVLLFINVESVHNLTDNLTVARDSLYRYVSHVDRLKIDSTKLQNRYLVAENGRLTKINEAEEAKSEGYAAKQLLAEKDQQTDNVVKTMSAIVRKKEADNSALNQRIGALLTTDNDSITNGQIVTLERRVVDRDTTIAKQARAYGTVVAENTTLRTDNRQLKDDKSELERELNGYNKTTADYIEAVPKGFANIGYGKRIKKASATIRAGRVPKQ